MWALTVAGVTVMCVGDVRIFLRRQNNKPLMCARDITARWAEGEGTFDLSLTFAEISRKRREPLHDSMNIALMRLHEDASLAEVYTDVFVLHPEQHYSIRRGDLIIGFLLDDDHDSSAHPSPALEVFMNGLHAGEVNLVPGEVVLALTGTSVIPSIALQYVDIHIRMVKAHSATRIRVVYGVLSYPARRHIAIHSWQMHLDPKLTLVPSKYHSALCSSGVFGFAAQCDDFLDTHQHLPSC